MWFVLFGGKYIHYTEASALMYDICNVYPADVEFVWHNCSSLCGYFNCEEVAFRYAECYSNLVHADSEVVEREAGEEIASLDYWYYGMLNAGKEHHCPDEDGLFCLACEARAEQAAGCCY